MTAQKRIPVAEAGSLICPADASLRDVMQRLSAAKHPLQLVVDAEGRLLGTMTDGDIRRGLLRPGASADLPVIDAMTRDPLVGMVGAEAENAQLLRKTRSIIPFLPIVDAERRLVEVLIGAAASGLPEAALVMAGGFGRRLGERTRNTPKPLLALGDRPILDHILNQIEDAGIKQVYLSVHYLAGQIEKFVADRNNRCRIALLHEDEPLGTAGALSLLPPAIDQSVIVLNGDIVTSANLPALSSFHARHGYDGTIAVAQHEVRVPYGVVRHNADGLFEGIEEKPSLRQFVAAGIYLLGPEIYSLAPRRQPIDMPEILNLARQVGLKIGLFPVHEYWADIGRPQDLDAARQQHESKQQGIKA